MKYEQMLRELELFSLEKKRHMGFYLFLDLSDWREYRRWSLTLLSGIQQTNKS